MFSCRLPCRCRAVLWIGALFALQTRAVGAVAEKLEITAGQGTVLDFDSDVMRVYTSNPEVADLVVITGREVVVNAKGQGTATLLVWLQSGERQSLYASVSSDLGPARKLLSDTFPKENLTINGSHDAISLVGRVSAQEVSDRAVLF